MTAIIAITIKIPTPIPALKMPSTSSQLVKRNEIRNNGTIFFSKFCMIFLF